MSEENSKYTICLLMAATTQEYSWVVRMLGKTISPRYDENLLYLKNNYDNTVLDYWKSRTTVSQYSVIEVQPDTDLELAARMLIAELPDQIFLFRDMKSDSLYPMNMMFYLLSVGYMDYRLTTYEVLFPARLEMFMFTLYKE